MSRALFLRAADAEAVAERLLRDGWTARVDALPHPAGEQDWLLVTDAPELVVEVLVERFDGWLESEG